MSIVSVPSTGGSDPAGAPTPGAGAPVPAAAGPQSAGTGVQQAGVSVVIPVRDRVPQLRTLLRSLDAAVACCPEPAEVIVVDDSDPAVAEQHRATCASHGARYLRGPRHVGAKRNLGAGHARHDLLLFVDSDCVADPQLLAAHLAALRAAAPQVVGTAGPTVVADHDARLFRIMSRSYLLNGDLERPAATTDVTWATTSNLAVRREAFLAVGGFAEQSLTVVSGEDVDLGLRLTAGGGRIRCEPGARVVHDAASTASLSTVRRRLYGYGRSEQWLVTIHPRYRCTRLNPVSALAVVTLAGLVGAPASAGASLLLIPLVAAALLAGGVLRDRRAARGGPLTDAVVRVVVESWFDVGAFVAALQLRRPGLLFAGLRVPQPAGSEPA